jgi:pimeloyl-ACP methyl ester carboxylesterase
MLAPDRFIETARGRFAALAAGPAGGPMVLCLHGFPDAPGTFRGLMTALGAAGFRTVAPWLRGYAPSPLHGEWGTAALGTDLLALCDALPATLVIGHDWGALAVYAALAQAPSRLRAAVTMAAPDLAVAFHNLPNNPRQLWRSRYAMLFQLPGAEHWLRRHDFAYVETLWRRWSPGFPLPAAPLADVKQTLAASGIAPLLHYRALLRSLLAGPPRLGTSPTPLLYLAGARDGCMGSALGQRPAAFASEHYSERIYPEAGHFLHLEQPAQVAADIVTWLRAIVPS